MVDPVPPPDTQPTRKPKSKRPLRDLFEGFGIALLMAVFFKYFAIEAYQIPTSSMQPTMMGSVGAGVYDRLIVDKFRYSIIEPKRWDIAVFKYPIRENQNYVKRIVGVGGESGERLRISGGNVYRVVEGDGSEPEHLGVLRKPELVQESIWKEVFPARMQVDGGSQVLGTWFSGRGGEWRERNGELEFTPRSESSRATLSFTGGEAAGFVNHVLDGKPTSIARTIREKESDTPVREQVQDVRLAFDLTTERAPKRMTIEIRVEQAGEKVLDFGFSAEHGKGRLFVSVNRSTVAESEQFDLPLGGGSRSFRLTHVDDLLTIEVDGDLCASLDSSGFKTLLPPKLVTPVVRVEGGGKLGFESLVVERDLHYIPSTRRLGPEQLTKVIEVPANHFMMLGDNTLQSVDSRDWTEIEIGVADGRVVDPRRHPDARRMHGNQRAMPLSQNPDPDENPVPITSLEKIVFTDRAGEVWTLDGQINLASAEDNRIWGSNGEPWFGSPDGPWKPEIRLVQFVPREHIIGRPLINFWPVFSPFRIGLIR